MKSQSTSMQRCIHRITALIEKEMKKSDICGLSIALVNDEGTIWSEGFGYTDFSKEEKITADTLFSLQSMTKCFTATTFLILASRGLIGLDDPIRKYYPEFVVNTKFGDPEKEIAKITFRRMLSHWASFTHEAPLGNNYDTTSCSFKEHIESISRSWLRSPVGSEYAYANVGFDLTGYVMGLVRDKSYEEVMNEELFTPLGISQATFNINQALKLSFAIGHSGSHKTPALQVPMIPAGGLYANANEVAKFVSFHLRKGENNGKQIIDSNLFADMYKPQFDDSRDVGYGLGVYNYETIEGAKAFTHGGGGYGYNTSIQWVPEHNIGAVVLVNDSKHSLPEKIMKRVLELLYELQSQPEMKSIDVADLRKLEGTYTTHRRSLYNAAVENNRLHIYQTNGLEYEIFPEDATNFVTRTGVKFKFNLDEEGNPISFDVEAKLISFTAKYNDGPNNKPGPNKMEWYDASGIYRFQADGRDCYLALTVLNGHLYLIQEDCLNLNHAENNLYFTADGEAILLEKESLLYRNIPAPKTDLDFDQLIESIRMDEIKYDRYRGTSDLVTILNAMQGFGETLSFIEKLVGIDSDFKIHYSQLGKKLYALGKIEDSLTCFTKLLELDDDEDAEEMIGKIKLRKELQMKLSN